MPNWCKGNIRFRGKKKDIKRFLLNEIVCCRMENHETIEERPVIDNKDYCLIITMPEKHSWFYIKDTHRNFFDNDILEIWMEEEDEEKEIIVCVDSFKVAWSFERCDIWKDIAKKYGFDVKMTGYEKGMHFSQIKIILRDGTMKDIIHEYENDDDWMWNCPQPNYGG